MPYRPENAAQARIDDLFRQLGGQVVPLRVDWAKRLESIHAAVVLQQLMFEARQHADSDGWFYVTADDMQDLTAVGERGYSAARGKLESLGLVETKKAGMPLRLYIRLLHGPLGAWIDEPRNKLRHIAEQAPTNGGTSSAPSQDMDRSEAEPYIEEENLITKVETRNDDPLEKSLSGFPVSILWDAALDSMERDGTVSHANIVAWLRPAKIAGVRDYGVVIVKAPHSGAARRITAYYVAEIQDAIADIVGHPVRIEVTA